MSVVSNSSPLIALRQIGHLDLLRQLFHEILIPDAVAREAATSISEQGWIVRRSLMRPVLPDALGPSLGAGEQETLSLAVEVQATAVILTMIQHGGLGVESGCR